MLLVYSGYFTYQLEKEEWISDFVQSVLHQSLYSLLVNQCSVNLIAPVFCELLMQLFNLSIVKGHFLSKWKVARVTPLHRDGVYDCRDNYRPISVLSVLSKLLKKHVASHLMNYMVQNNLLYKLQSAFHDNHSTESALIHLTDQILFNLDQDEVTGMVLVDFRKAFDVVDHELLLRKLHLYRVSDGALFWFKSYLSDRYQFVSFEGNLSVRL